jgi:hypothetical protein
MGAEQNDVLLRAEPQQFSPPERPALQIETLLTGPRDETLDLCRLRRGLERAQVTDGQGV